MTESDPRPDDGVGVGPHPRPWPDDERLDPDLLAGGDRRNVVDRYRYWTMEAIVADLDERRHPFHVAVENWQHDLNIGSVVRNANAFGAAAVHIVGRRRWNRRGAMVTDRYQHLRHHPDVETLGSWADGEGLVVIGIDNLPGCVPLEDTELPSRCVLLFGQEGPGLSPAARRIAHLVCSIGMTGSTRSINASVASGIAMHTWTRQHVHGHPALTMLILLPPSESKAVGRRGRPLALERLSFPGLNPAREAVLDALVHASGLDDALDVLDAPKGAADRVAANRRLRSAPTLRVSDLYTGVLYDALDHDSLDPVARRRASRRLVVVSALFGALRIGDRVPSYRLSMGVDLPGAGKLAAVWRGPLADVLPTAAGRGLVVDMRSADYVAAWRPSGALAERTVAVHVVRETDRGRAAVSHMAKHTRGLVARYLLETGVDPRTPEALADALAPRFDVDLDDASPGRIRRLEIVEPT